MSEYHGTKQDQWNFLVDEWLTKHGLGDPSLGLEEPSWGELSDAQAYADEQMQKSYPGWDLHAVNDE